MGVLTCHDGASAWLVDGNQHVTRGHVFVGDGHDRIGHGLIHKLPLARPLGVVDGGKKC